MNRVFPLLALFAWLAVAGAQTPAPAPEKAADRVVYIPYERLWQVFEKQGRGVFLPYEDYERLREAARAKEAVPVKEPVPSLVAEATGMVTFADDVATVVASLRVEVLAKGWQRVPLGLRDVAVSEAKVGGAPARLVFDAEIGYALLVENPTDAPLTVVLDLTFAKACTKSPGRNAVRFQPPPAPVGRWEIRIPEPGVKVEVEPVVAATEAASANGKETIVRAFVGAAKEIQIAWTPKAEGARGLQALVSVDAKVRVNLGEGIARVQANLISTITRAEIPGQTLVVPAGYRVVNVFDENVRAWSVKTVGETQEIAVEFFKPVQGEQGLLVELERLANEATVAVPSVAVRGASRELGLVLVGVASGLRAEVERRERLAQEDLAELVKAWPQAQGETWQFGYRYVALPYELSFRLAKVEARVLGTTLSEFQLTPEALRLDYTVLVDVQRAGLFHLDLAVPEGYGIEEVVGVEVPNGAAAAVDGFHAGEPAAGMVPLVANLSRRAFGLTGLRVRLLRKLNEPGLQRPGESATALTLPLPRLAIGQTEREVGGLIVYAPSSLAVTPTGTTGLRTVPPAAAQRDVPAVGAPGLAPVLSCLCTEPVAEVRLDARRRPPYATVSQTLLATFESTNVRYDLELAVSVQYSGIERIRLDLPTDLPSPKVTPESVRLAPWRGDPPADLAPGYTAWLLEPETEFMGGSKVRLWWTSPIDVLEVGKSATVSIPRTVVRGVDQTSGHILLAKASGIGVELGDYEGLRPIDPRHDLPPSPWTQAAAFAFEFHGDWQLAAKATRYETQEIKVTSIERGLVRMVLTRGQVTSVQAIYKVSTLRQRLVLSLPKDAQFDTHHLRLNGRNANLERGEGGTHLVPLQGLAQGTPFLMELRYTVPRGSELVVPAFPEEPAVQQVYLSVHVPDELAYLGHRGVWHPEFAWALTRNGALQPKASRSAPWLIDWVVRGVSVDPATVQDFVTDGYPLLFSTLCPAAGEAGALRVTLFSAAFLRGLLAVVILAVGLLLLRASFGRKLAAALVVLLALILLGMVLPSLARSMVGMVSVAAIAVVGGTWLVWCLVVLRPRLSFVTCGKPRPAVPPPVPGAKPEDQGGADHV